MTTRSYSPHCTPGSDQTQWSRSIPTAAQARSWNDLSVSAAPRYSGGAVAMATLGLTDGGPFRARAIGGASVVVGRSLVPLALGPATVAVVTGRPVLAPTPVDAGMATRRTAVVCGHGVPRGLHRSALHLDRAGPVLRGGADGAADPPVPPSFPTTATGS